ncbi:amidase signature enzyme [Xylariaceae sp. FL0255]|nr:amidase signature enzyme [Xylariaceae sp. FL0255]
MPIIKNYEQLADGAAKLDPVIITCTELQRLLSDGHIRSVDLVGLYLEQIDRQNHCGLELNAMISVTPVKILYEIADALDRERQTGVTRGPLHGIPITVKDNIMTGPEFYLPTTVGTLALENAIATSNAPVIDLLVQAGAIIIGKANLSEMAGWKGFDVTTGWSAVGGQTQSPYIIGGFKHGDKLLGHSAPAGSSSGSAVSVASGFAPLALATETDGSIVQPANRAALYGMKATVGRIPTEGTAPWSPITDSIGGMAKSPRDLSSLFEVLLQTELSSELTGLWSGKRVGVVDFGLWSFSPSICDPDPSFIQQQRMEMEAAIAKIREHGAIVHEAVPLTSVNELVLDGKNALDMIWNHDFNVAWSGFLQRFEGISIKSVKDIVEFNRQNAERALPPQYPGQQLLEGSIDMKNIISQEEYEKGLKVIHNAARTQGIDKTLNEYNIDVILGPMDGRIPTIAAAAGYPVGTMPLGYSKTNGRPFGVCIVASKDQEHQILRVMSAWDRSIGNRKPPPQMSNNGYSSEMSGVSSTRSKHGSEEHNASDPDVRLYQ